MQIVKIPRSIWEYKVGINAIIANFVCLWKCGIDWKHLYSYQSLQMPVFSIYIYESTGLPQSREYLGYHDVYTTQSRDSVFIDPFVLISVAKKSIRDW